MSGRWARTRARTRRGATFGTFRMKPRPDRNEMKPINPFPLIAMLILVLVLLYWMM